MTTRSIVVWALVVCGAWTGLVGAAESEDAETPPAQPRVVLVLSGGGARGAAHIGVLKVLEELRVPVDMVVGTSMGSIVGGLYAAGWSPEDIESLLLKVDWAQIFSDKVERSNLSFRRKQDDYPYLIQTRLRFKGFKPYIPPSVLGGQRLELLMRSIEMYSTGETDFDRLPIPYRAVACDLATGEAVVIDRGSLATALRASMSIPAAFPPVELDGRTLVDGGSAANFPVGIAQGLGAQHLIGVDISSPLGDEGLDSVFGVYGQLSSILIAGNRDVDTRRMRPSDVLIVPELGDLSFIAFDRAAEAVGLGEQAARAKVDALRQFAVSDEEYAAFQQRHRRQTIERPVIDEVTLVNTSPVADELIERHLHVETGEPLDYQQLSDNLINLYNLGYFGLIRTGLDRSEGGHSLVIETPDARHGRASLQFGLSFANDFEGDSRHAFAVRHRLLALTRRGGEWQNVFQVGHTSLLGSELYLPFDYDMTWFASPYVERRETTTPIWSDGEQVAEYRVDRLLARLDLGRVLGQWGEVRLRAIASSNDGETRIGASGLPDAEADLSGVELGFRVDTLDAPVFPTRGLRVNAHYGEGLDALGSDEEYQNAFLAVDGAMSWKGLTFEPRLELGSNFHDDVSFFNLYRLGGFRRLSGLGQGELIGKHSALATFAVFQELTEIRIASAKVRAFAGITLEAGNTFASDDGITWDALRTGGSVFVGVETSAGPAYLAWGYTDGGRDRISFTFGQSF